MKSTTIIVLAVLLILCVVYVMVARRGGPLGAADRPGEQYVFGRRIDGFVSLTIEAEREHRITLERIDGVWRITSPISARANALLVSQIAASLGELRFTDTVGKDELGDPQFGLASPVWRIVATTEQGEQFELLVGKRTPRLGAGVRTYVRPVLPGTGAADACVVAMDFDRLLDHPINDFRDRWLLAAPPGHVTSLSVEGEHRYALRRGGQGWEITLSPELTAPANQSAVLELVRRVLALRANGFVNIDPGDAARHGLTESDARLVVKITFGAEADQATADQATVLLGHQSGQDIYAKLADDEAVFLLDGSMLSELQPDPVSLRSTRVVRLEPADVARISITAPGGDVELTRQDGEWRMLEPIAGPADQASVAQLLAGMSVLQAIDFHDDMPMAEFGLDDPNATITLHLSPPLGPQGELTLVVGSLAPDGGGVVVRSDHQPTPLTISSAAAKLLLNGPGHYYTRSIGMIPPDVTITRLVLNRPDGTFTAVVDDEGHWRMLAPTVGRADDETVRRVIAQLRDLKYERITSWAPDLPDTYRSEFSTTIMATVAAAPPEEGDPAQPTQTYVVRIVRLYDEWSGQVIGTYAWAPGMRPLVAGEVDPSVYDSLMVNISWRRLWEVEPHTVRQIQIAQGVDEPFVLERTDGHWSIADDPYARVNVTAVADYLEAIKELNVQEYLSDLAVHMDRFNLDVPWLTVQLTCEDETVHRIIVADHGPGESNTSRYASATNLDTVFLISAETMSRLARHPSDFRAD